MEHGPLDAAVTLLVYPWLRRWKTPISGAKPLYRPLDEAAGLPARKPHPPHPGAASRQYNAHALYPAPRAPEDYLLLRPPLPRLERLL